MVLARKAVEPRTSPEYTSFLLRWHGLLDGGWSGPTGLREVLGKLQGLYLPAQIWEQYILAPRVKGYQPAWLDQICASGEVVWAGTGGTGPGGRRLAFYLRQDIPFLSVPPSQESLSSEEQAVVRVMEQHGALFLDDMEHISRMDRAELVGVLWDLVWKGWVTHDGFQPIRNFRNLPQAVQQAGPRRHGGH
jgi:ATP-dependent Lhr-like helicase